MPTPETESMIVQRMGTDADKWARNFLSVFIPDDDVTADQIDVARGWFANAISTGESEGYSRAMNAPYTERFNYRRALGRELDIPPLLAPNDLPIRACTLHMGAAYNNRVYVLEQFHSTWSIHPGAQMFAWSGPIPHNFTFNVIDLPDGMHVTAITVGLLINWVTTEITNMGELDQVNNG